MKELKNSIILYLIQTKDEWIPFLLITLAGISIVATFIGGIFITSAITDYLRNSRYKVDLIEYKKCASKFQDASVVETFCGSSPNRPLY